MKSTNLKFNKDKCKVLHLGKKKKKSSGTNIGWGDMTW